MAPANQGESVQAEVDLLGEGNSTGIITPGQSLVFSALEVCLCLLVRALPALNPTPIVSPVSLARPGQPHSAECGQLVASALNVMEELPSLCSPKGRQYDTSSFTFPPKLWYLYTKCVSQLLCLGAVAILPTILYLTTGVMREWATKNVTDSTVVATGTPVSAALHCLRLLCTHRYCCDEHSQQEWQKLLTSALAKVIDLAKTGKTNILNNC